MSNSKNNAKWYRLENIKIREDLNNQEILK